MLFTPEEIQQLFFVVDYRIARVIADVLGKEYLSQEDIDMLKRFDFDLKTEVLKIPPYWQAFIFGRLAAILTPAQLSSLNFNDLQQYVEKEQYPELTSREKAEYNAAAMRSYSYIKGMGTRIKDSLSSTISEEEMKIAVAEREREVETAIREELTEGVLKRKSVQSIVSSLGHRLDEWNRDWGRIVATEMENIFQIGIAQTIMKEHGIHAKVYKETYPGACRICLNAYTTAGAGSKPVIFDLSELIANGTNIGKKSKDWKATLSPIHPFCFSEDTEVFTNEGWKTFQSLNKNELFLSVNPDTEELEWVKAVRWINQHYKGKMIERTNRSFSLCTTPNHHHAISTRKIKGICLTSERFLPEGASFRCAGFKWTGVDKDYFYFDGYKYKADLFCQFMGYFLSEGSATSNKCANYIVLSQFDGDKKEKMFECLSNMGLKPFKSKEYIGATISERKELFAYLKSFGHAYDKFVPKEIKELSPNLLNIFLTAFREGDGVERKPKVYDGYVCKPEVQYFTSSIKLCNDIGEILLKLGYRPSYRNFGKVTAFDKRQNKTYTSKYDNWRIRQLSAKGCSVLNVQMIDYDGMIGDVELEKYHTLIVRRNGKVCLSGNCRCNLRYIPDGYEWDDKTQSFEPKKTDESKRVQRKSKVKITVGTKYFEV